jgi:hypothetical protein
MGALASINVKWTGGGATASFKNAGVEQNWTYVSGGTGLLAAGDYPGTGSTLNYLYSYPTVAYAASDLPDAGEVFALVFSDDTTCSPKIQLGTGSWSASSIISGDATHHSNILTLDINGSCPVTLYNVLYDNAIGAVFDYDVTVKDGGEFDLYSTDITGTNHRGTIVIEAGGVLGTTGVFSNKNNVTGQISLAGLIKGATMGRTYLVCASPILVIADTADINWAKVNITGGLNANGFLVTHTNTTGASLICDVAGILNLGGPAVELAVEVDAAGLEVTAGADTECGSFTMTAGTFTGGAYNVTTHGSIVHTAGTITGTGEWDMQDTGNLNLDCATAHLRISAGTATMTDDVSVASVFIEAGATLDGDSNNMTAPGGIGGRGTLTNLTPSADVHVAPGVIDGGGNNEHVIFDRLPNIISTNGVGCAEVIYMD